jgi:hypothetical protein
MIENSSYHANQNAPEQTTAPSQPTAGGSGSGCTLAQQSEITLMPDRMAEICEWKELSDVVGAKGIAACQ